MFFDQVKYFRDVFLARFDVNYLDGRTRGTRGSVGICGFIFEIQKLFNIINFHA